MGRCGGLSFAQRLRTVRLDASVTETRTRRSYYDQEAVSAVFGEDSKERMDDETKGLGPVYRHPSTGELIQRDRKGDMRSIGAEQVQRQFEGDELEDIA